MSEQEFEVLAVIAARKSAYYTYVREAFLKELNKEKLLPKGLEEEVGRKLQEAVANLPNELFLSKAEKANKKIYSNLGIDKLGLDQEEIKRLVLRKLEGM